MKIISMVLIGGAFAGGYYLAQKRTKDAHEFQLDQIRADLLDFFETNHAEYSGEDIVEIVDTLTQYVDESK